MGFDLTKFDDQQIENLIANYLKQGKHDTDEFAAFVAEQNRRNGRGLELQTTLRLLHDAARERRFVSYKDVADASGLDWAKARRLIPHHLGGVCRFAHRHGWPLVSAIVVNAPNRDKGTFTDANLGGFTKVARELGHVVTDAEALVYAEQERVFAWGQEDIAAAG